ncbi:MAG: Na+/H+ antiporter subunit E [bacterium]
MAKRGSQILGFIIAFLAWLALTWNIDAASIGIGLVFSLLATMFFGELLTLSPQRALHITRYFWLLYYLPVFLWQMVKSNIDVAYRVLHPGLPIDPGLIKVQIKLKSDVAKVLLANSISLTPGSTTVDLIGDQLYIHCIDVRRPVRKEVEMFEKIIERMLG